VEEKKGIKETKEFLAGLELLAISFKKIAKDGVSLADLPEALALLKKVDSLLEAVKGIDEVPSEVKDLDQEELMEIGLKVFAMIKSIKES